MSRFNPALRRKVTRWQRVLHFFHLYKAGEGRVNTTSLGDLSEEAHMQECLLEGHKLGATKEEMEHNNFTSDLVATLKNRWGSLKRTESVEATVRLKMAKLMEEHGMRPTHIRERIELALNAFFLADRAEHVAKALTASTGQQFDQRVKTYGYESGSGANRIAGIAKLPKT